jgi:class 3 adenylate cyclase/tetratricopeptide (TPR) repeat protein
MHCSKCNADNVDGLKFCNQCGTPFNTKCAACGLENVFTAKFCGECGAALGRPATATPTRKPNAGGVGIAETPAADNLEGERKTVTALFADIKGSTELEQDLDPEEARAIVDPALKLMIDAVHRYDGYVVQSTGDGIFAIFGAPVAHEDHPQRALYAALRMQEELRRYSTRLVADGGNPLQCRVGVNTGEVVVRSISTGGGHTEYTPIGHTTNLASRMQAVAPVGSIAVAEPTRKLCEGYFALKPLGPTRVKGLSEPVNVFEVAGLGPLRTRLQRSAGRGLTKFVGREREMDAMRKASESAHGGRGQIVAAIAEAGSGKSRLFFEFKAKNQSGWMVLEAFSVSHGKASPYLPVLDLLHTYFKIVSDDDARARREKVTGRVLALDRSLEDALPYLFALLGVNEGDDPLEQMDAQVKKRRTLDAIKRILLRESLSQPLMVMFEDLHWIDEGTQEFLNLFADSIANARILLLVNYRPEYSHQWGSKTYYTQLRLDPLGKESADEMLAALLGDNPQLAQLKRVIVERTEGNPFFMEETVQVLLDEGALVRDAGKAKLTKPIAELKIPPTVQGILAARIDRLPADAKDLLQTLSVIGRQFTMPLIRAVVSSSSDDLERMLNDLQLGEFIYEQPAVGDTEYVFKHALTQEVAYNSVLIERRKQIHEHIGIAMESLCADSLDDHVDELARHFSRGMDIDKAVKYLSLAGTQSLARFAYAQAHARLTEGLQLIERLPESPDRDIREFALAEALVEAGARVGVGLAERSEDVDRALRLAEKTGDLAGQIRILNVRRTILNGRGDFSAGAELAKRILELAQREGSAESLATAYNAALYSHFFLGNLAGVEEQFALYKTVRDAGPSRRRYVGVAVNFSAGAICAGLMGHIGLARDRIAEAEAAAVAGKDPVLLMTASMLAAIFYSWCIRDAERVIAGVSRWEAIVRDSQVQVAYNPGAYKAWAFARLGRSEEALAFVQELLLRRSRGAPTFASVFRGEDAFVAEVQAAARMHAAAMDSVQLAIASGTQAGVFTPDIIRIRGDVFAGIGQPDKAEADFRDAIARSQKIRAKMFELRATVSLARLLRDTDRREEARAMLAENYSWFTDGFDTADLKDAKALLDELVAH